jgi:hypothetical protein
MATIVTRAGKGSPLTHNEVDSNFINLNTDKVELTGTSPVSISVSTAGNALSVTQSGAGNALLVEDSASPDSTPFIVTADGRVGMGVPNASYFPGNIGLYITANDGNYRVLFQRMSDDSSGPQFFFRKGRGTVEVRTGVQSGDRLGTISYSGHVDTSNNYEAASIFAEVDGTPGINDMPGRLVFSTTADGASSPTERMRIDNAGNVGIGGTPTVDLLRLTGTAAGGTTINGLTIDETVGSGVTANYRSVLSRPILQNATFTLNNLYHFYANPQTKPAAATLSNQYGFHAESTLTDATANYGFYGNIASATGRWNFYAAGTAPNYFAGNTTCNTGLTVNGTTNLSALTASTALALDSSKNIVSVTNTGSGDNVLATSPTLITPNLGTPSAITLTNATGTASININGTVGATTPTTGALTPLSASSLGLNGSSSGTVTVNTAAAAGTWTLTLPTSAGTNGYVLSTDGAGVTSWVAQSGGGGGVTSFSAGTTGLTPNTATTGAVTLAGTLAVANGGTGVTTSTGTGSVVLSNSPALGSIGIGTSAGAAIGAVIGGTLSGSSSGASIQAQPTIGSGITGEYTTYKSRPITQAATFTLANMVHFYAQPQAKGAGSTITAQYGFLADSGMTDATITYGFYSGIASGTNRFGVYMAGTAVNYFGGLVRIGSASAGDQQLNVNGAVRVAGATSANQTSAGTMDFNTASGQMRFLSWGASGTQGIFTWWTGAGAASTTQRMTLNGSNNLGLATSTFGTSATNTFSVFTGTAPTTGPADTVQFYSTDLSAGNTIPSFYTEGTNVGTGTPTANRTIAVRFNGTIYYLLASTIP